MAIFSYKCFNSRLYWEDLVLNSFLTWYLCSLMIQQRPCVFLLRSAQCTSFPPILWPPCPFHCGCCCIPVLLILSQEICPLSLLFGGNAPKKMRIRLTWTKTPCSPECCLWQQKGRHVGACLTPKAGFSCSLQTIAAWEGFQHPALHCSFPLVYPMLTVGFCHMWGVPCQDMCAPCEKQAPQLCPEPKLHQLCFFSKALFGLGREEWGDFPWAMFLFNFFFSSKGISMKNFISEIEMEWDVLRLFFPFCSSCLLAPLSHKASFLQLHISSYSCVFHLEAALNFCRILA